MRVFRSRRSVGIENGAKRDSEVENRGPHAARYRGRVGPLLSHLGVRFRPVFNPDGPSLPKNPQYIPLSADLISHREFSSDLCFLLSLSQVLAMSCSGSNLDRLNSPTKGVVNRYLSSVMAPPKTVYFKEGVMLVEEVKATKNTDTVEERPLVGNNLSM